MTKNSKEEKNTPVQSYRSLKTGEIIMEGDEVDMSFNRWYDDPIWKPTTCVGQRTLEYPAHRLYRRLVEEIKNDKTK